MAKNNELKQRATKLSKLLDLVHKYPGLDGIALKGKGYRPQVHGSLRDAENDGYLTYRNGWYIDESAADDGPYGRIS